MITHEDNKYAENDKKMKDEKTRLDECLDIRVKLRHTDCLHAFDNERQIKESMQNFIKNGVSSTLRLWTSDKKKQRMTLILTNNKNRKSGISLEFLGKN